MPVPTTSLGARLTTMAMRAANIATAPFGHRGLFRAAKHVARFNAPGSTVDVKLNADSNYRLDLDDPYWMRLLAPRYRYAPEVYELLFRLRSTEYRFLDCGANGGYWSVLTSSAAFGRKNALAVEATLPTYQRLTENLRLNDGRFEVRHNAVWSSTGESVEMTFPSTSNRGAARMKLTNAGPLDDASCMVDTTTIDALVASWSGSHAPIVVKLDVEGAEIDAFNGAAQTLADHDCIVVYEDHGNDPLSRVSAHALGLGLQIFAVDASGLISPRTSPASVSLDKTDVGLGYNYIAAKPSSALLASLDAA